MSETNLLTYRPIFINMKVEHPDPTVCCDGGEDGAGVGRPGHVPHRVANVVAEDRTGQVCS